MTTQENGIAIFQMSASERNQAMTVFANFRFDETISIDVAVLDSRRRWTRAMPTRVLAAVDAMRRGTGPAVIVVQGLPFDGRIDRGLRDPAISLAPKLSRLSEVAVLGAAASLGEPYGVSTEGEGVVNNLCPTFADRQALTGLGSARTLGLHVENMALRRHPLAICPDGLVLVGVSGDPAGNPPTMVADARQALALVSEETRAQLTRPFGLKVPERWRGAMAQDRVLAPVVVGNGNSISFAFAFYGDMMEASDTAGVNALAEFEAALESVAVGVEVDPGTLVIIDNRVAAHGRGAFKASFEPDGTPRRWLQRSFWTTDLSRFEVLAETSRRVFDPGRRR